jgi:uncharacterized repeat protein (TIGR03803 family)
MTLKNSLANTSLGSGSMFGNRLSALVIPTVIFLSALTAPLAQGQTFQVLHSFTGKSGGTEPYAGMTIDQAGNLYGTTIYGGFYNAAQCSGAGCGIAYRLNPAGQETVIYAFEGRSAGGRPIAGLLRDGQGNLYGTTLVGGDSNCNPPYGCGVVFKIDTAGHETALHRFTGENDGIQPQGTLIRDGQGNLYGTTVGGFPGAGGTVFKIDSTGNETVLHAFTGPPDGSTPLEGLVRDAQGNLYGSTELGGNGKSCGSFGCGIVYKISAKGEYKILYNFSGGEDGSEAGDTLVLDSEGNLYGMTGLGGVLTCNPPYGCGVIFKIDPTGAETVLYRFANETSNGYDPISGVIRDASGNLYGTTYRGGANGMGTVFKLDAAGNETLLHSFTGRADGAYPYAGLTMDVAGSLYGTTLAGGLPGCVFEQGCGVVFKITP